MNKTLDPRSLMEQPLRADELAKWPLMHGTLQTNGALASIRREGLAAGREDSNSFDYDIELGRTNFLFLAPASFRLNYGFGCGAVLVDPVVLARNNLLCSDQDIGDAISCLKIAIDGEDNYCGTAKDVPALNNMMNAQKAVSSTDDPDELVKEVVRTQGFRDYYSQHYQMSPPELFRRVEDEAQSLKLSLRGYFARTGLWPLHEEILVPESVEPELLLGHFDGQHWTEWNRASNADVQIRLEVWIAAAAMRGRR